MNCPICAQVLDGGATGEFRVPSPELLAAAQQIVSLCCDILDAELGEEWR